MATHSSVLAWRIPGTAEPGGLAEPQKAPIPLGMCVMVCAREVPLQPLVKGRQLS